MADLIDLLAQPYLDLGTTDRAALRLMLNAPSPYDSDRARRRQGACRHLLPPAVQRRLGAGAEP